MQYVYGTILQPTTTCLSRIPLNLIHYVIVLRLMGAGKWGCMCARASVSAPSDLPQIGL